MKKLVFLIFIFAETLHAQPLTFITYNIRYDNPDDGDDAWEVRKSWLANQIRFYEPDVLGIQEGLHQQVVYLHSELTQYDYTGVGRDDGKEKGEYSAIFYNKTKLDLLKSGTFWLSKTPEKPSKGWDANIVRICTYALFQNKNSKKIFFVFNTHFDHKGTEARKNSALLIIEKINQLNTLNYPVILMGDFNAQPDDEPVKIIKEKMKDTRDVSISPPFGPEGTANGFEFDKPVTKRIDYIFTKGKISVSKYAILSDAKNLHYPSDHLPVYSQITID